MRTHVALLRGMNVGRDRSVSTADLKALLAALGHRDVVSYVQSGNFVFSSDEAGPADLATGLEQAMGERLGVVFDTVVLTRDELATVIEGNPFPQEPNPKYLHAVLRQHDPPPEVLSGIDLAVARAEEKGSPDEAALVGRTLYLHTPNGMGRSELAAQLARTVRPGRGYEVGTARNWATVTKLLALLDG